jgi:hypothetical protein
MPTKARKARGAILEAEKAALEEFFASKPGYLNTAEANNADLITDSSEYRLRGGLVSGDDHGNLLINSAAMARRNDSANRDRQQIAEADIGDLQRKYAPIWLMRGAAKRIAIEEAESGNPVSVRTVQNYIAQSKKRKASKAP